MNQEDERFYREQYQKLLFEKLGEIEIHLKTQDGRLQSIEKKVGYIYAWAAGAGAIGAVVFYFFKEKILKI